MNTSRVLSIDTSQTHLTRVSLSVGDEVVVKETDKPAHSSQTVLPLIEELMTELGLRLTDITAITVNTGPGSFTGLRVGVAIAQMLGVLLGVPVNGNEPANLPPIQYASSKWD